MPFSLSASGLQVTFTTETYEGDSGGANNDGADGISFFLQDASAPVNYGDAGGSLGYTCSNQNGPPTGYAGYDGMVGGYLGLGIDEYGNFLNGDVRQLASVVVTYGATIRRPAMAYKCPTPSGCAAPAARPGRP